MLLHVDSGTTHERTVICKAGIFVLVGGRSVAVGVVHGCRFQMQGSLEYMLWSSGIGEGFKVGMCLVVPVVSYLNTVSIYVVGLFRQHCFRISAKSVFFISKYWLLPSLFRKKRKM